MKSTITLTFEIVKMNYYASLFRGKVQETAGNLPIKSGDVLVSWLKMGLLGGMSAKGHSGPL